jgi:hypothetical protein
MTTLTINLTKTLVAEWSFSDPRDFDRASIAARTWLPNHPLVDVDDLQSLVDAVLAPFDEWPSDGEVTFDVRTSNVAQALAA